MQGESQGKAKDIEGRTSFQVCGMLGTAQRRARRKIHFIEQ
jgi:hypothetical protein